MTTLEELGYLTVDQLKQYDLKIYDSRRQDPRNKQRDLEVYKEPHADELAKVGPQTMVQVCYWRRFSEDDDWYPERCDVDVTDRTGDEFSGIMFFIPCFDELEPHLVRITFELKHICFIYD
jgi:hypothetical protein